MNNKKHQFYCFVKVILVFHFFFSVCSCRDGGECQCSVLAPLVHVCPVSVLAHENRDVRLGAYIL